MFPKDITLEETLEAIKGFKEFKIVQTKEGYTFIKYFRCDKDTFPEISTAKNEKEKRKFLIRRECRGVTFRTLSGKCVARRFHKFFNVNEREETNIEKIDFKRPFVLVEKLDGSLVSPLLVKDEILFCSMSGFTELTTNITKFISEHPDNKYYEFSAKMMKDGKTPLFEWCDSKLPIVINHEKDNLCLLNIRDISTG